MREQRPPMLRLVVEIALPDGTNLGSHEDDPPVTLRIV